MSRDVHWRRGGKPEATWILLPVTGGLARGSPATNGPVNAGSVVAPKVDRHR